MDSAHWVAEGEPLALLPGSAPSAMTMGFCRVHGIATPVSDSQIGFEVWLPDQSHWNGKYLQAGNGGSGGRVPLHALADALRRGYAAAATDTGHESADALDFSWALGHPARVVDFGWRAMRRTTDAAKRIVAAGLGRRPRRSYFVGCSDGGRDALMAAQRFPREFDGIVAGAPANAWIDLMSEQVLAQQQLFVPQPVLRVAQLPAIQAASRTACGGGSYLHEPQKCRFDPARMQCAGEETDACLNPSQVAAVRMLYTGMRNPATGRWLPGLEPGGEAQPGNWDFWELRSPGAADKTKGSRGIGESFFRYAVRGDPELRLAAITTADLKHAYALWHADLDAIDPDLAPFKTLGGKLLEYQGWTDAAVPPRGSIEYFESVQSRVPDTRDFYRLFLVPGMNHCVGGSGPWQVDWIGAIEAWVERGEPPAELTATHPESGQSQPLTPYRTP